MVYLCVCVKPLTFKGQRSQGVELELRKHHVSPYVNILQKWSCKFCIHLHCSSTLSVFYTGAVSESENCTCKKHSVIHKGRKQQPVTLADLHTISLHLCTCKICDVCCVGEWQFIRNTCGDILLHTLCSFLPPLSQSVTVRPAQFYAAHSLYLRP